MRKLGKINLFWAKQLSIAFSELRISQIFLYFIVSYNMAIYPRDIEEFQKIRSSFINCYMKKIKMIGTKEYKI